MKGRMSEAQEECGNPDCRNRETLLAGQKRPNAARIRENQFAPRRGQANAIAIAMVVRPPSISINEGPPCEAGVMSI
jgi:hypothetical protein